MGITFVGCKLIIISPVVFTVAGLNVMVMPVRAPGDKVTAEN